MLELLTRLLDLVMPSITKSFHERPRLKIIGGWGYVANVDGVGNFLALWVKIINPTRASVFFERLEAVDKSGETFFPLFFCVHSGDEVSPQRNTVGLIPCGHISSISPKEIFVYDSTERRYRLGGKSFRKIVDELETEKIRLENLGMSVHPSAPYPDRKYRHEQ